MCSPPTHTKCVMWLSNWIQALDTKSRWDCTTPYPAVTSLHPPVGTPSAWEFLTHHQLTSRCSITQTHPQKVTVCNCAFSGREHCTNTMCPLFYTTPIFHSLLPLKLNLALGERLEIINWIGCWNPLYWHFWMQKKKLHEILPILENWKLLRGLKFKSLIPNTNSF